MRFFFGVLAAVLLVGSGTLVQAQGVRTVAIADFVDESHDGLLINAGQLNATLERFLADRAGGRLRIVPTADVRNATRAQGITARDLVSPTKAGAVAQAVRADWIVTGRWTHLDADVFTLPSTTDPTTEVPLYIEGAGVLEVIVLEPATHRVVLRDTYMGEARGVFRLGVLLQAAYRALARAADGISRL